MIIISPKLTKKPVIYFHFLRIVNMKRTPPTHTNTTFVSCSQYLPVVSSPAFDSGHRVSCLAMRSKRNFLLQKRHSSSKLESESIALPSRTSRKTFPTRDGFAKRKKNRKNTPAILNMSLAGKSTVKVDVFCFFKKSEIHCDTTRAFDTNNTILVVGEMNGLSFRKENYHPATVRFRNFSEKGNVVQSWLSFRMV